IRKRTVLGCCTGQCLRGTERHSRREERVGMTRGVDITRGEQSATDTPMGTPPGREAPSRLPERIPVEIRVADTGTGILAANRDKVFDLCFTPKEVGRGTGQALAIAHGVVVQKHKGTISFE